MVIEVKLSIAGYDGERIYCDATRSWDAYARPTGATWWTNCGWIGPVGMPAEELDAKAVEKIERWIEHGLVR